jgi:hypothetical protein
MADIEYWVAQSDSTNWNNTMNWSTSSGGHGGAPVPNTSSFVVFDRSGSGPCSIDANAQVTIANLSLSGYRGSFFGDWTTTTLYLNSGDASAGDSDSSVHVLGNVYGSSSFGSWSSNNNLPVVFDGTVTQYLINESGCICPQIVVNKDEIQI